MAVKLVTDSALNKAMNLLTGDRDMILNVYDPAAGRRQVAFSDELPTAEEKAAWNDSDVFIATYGTTTFAEVDAAYKAGKEILCNWDNKIFRLSFYYNYGTPQYSFEMNGWSVTLLKDRWTDMTRTIHASTHASGGADALYGLYTTDTDPTVNGFINWTYE